MATEGVLHRSCLAGLVVAALSWAGCSAAPPRSPDAAAADPTHGICPARRSVSPRDAKSALAAAQDALNRGCFAEASNVLDQLEASGLEQTSSHRAKARLLSLAVRVEAQTMGLDRQQPRALWFPSANTPDVANTDTDELNRELDSFAAALEEGSVTLLGEDARIAEVFIRGVGAVRCDRSLLREAVSKQIEQYRAKRRSLLAQMMFSPHDDGPSFEVMGRDALWDCRLDEAAEQYRKAAKRFEQDGRASEAALATMHAIEVASFPGGRSGDLALVESYTIGEIVRQAAMVELASRGEGPSFEAGKTADQKLADLEKQLPSAPSTLAVRAELGRVRAAVALRLLGKPAEASRLARQAVQHAIRANRADLLDAARWVLVLAELHRGKMSSMREQLIALLRSLNARGAYAGRDKVMAQVVAAALEHSHWGKPDRARKLLEVAAGAPGLVPLQILQARIVRARIASDAGRLELALAEYRAGLRYLDHHRTSFKTASVDQLRKSVAAPLGAILELLGRLEEANEITDAPPYLRTITKALMAGDESALRHAREADPEQWASTVILLEGFCGAVRNVPELAEIMRTGAGVLHQQDRDVFVAGGGADPASHGVKMAMRHQQAPHVAWPMARCGAVLHDEAVVRAGRSFQRDLSMGGTHHPAHARALDGALAEAGGDFAAAAGHYLNAARSFLEHGSLDARGGVGLSQFVVKWYRRAVISLLKNGQASVADAIAALEESRARDLRAARAAAPQSGASGLGAVARTERQMGTVQARLRGLAAAIAISQGPARKALESARDRWQARLETLRTQRDKQAAAIQTRDPRTYRAAALAPPPTLGDIRRAIQDDEVVVYYVTEAEEAYAIVVDRTGAQAIRLDGLAEDGLPRLLLTVRRLRRLTEDRLKVGRGLELKGTSSPTRSTLTSELESCRQELHDLMVRPVTKSIPKGRRVIIIPDGLTADLPFASLGSKQAPWAARNPLRMVPGAHLLLDRRTARSGAGKVLVVGDPEFAGKASSAARRAASVAGHAWQALPGARVEARSTAKLYGVEPLLGSDASEERVVKEMALSSTIHLATHGVADLRRPQYSALILAKPRSGERGDGILHAYEIERLRLKGGLVVLSACETGRGRSRGDEGIMALDRAFLVAGADAVLSSLWVVDDRSTEQLMRLFHQRARRGHAADRALAEAMMAVRRRSQWSDPYFWSGFRLVGPGLR